MRSLRPAPLSSPYPSFNFGGLANAEPRLRARAAPVPLAALVCFRAGSPIPATAQPPPRDADRGSEDRMSHVLGTLQNQQPISLQPLKARSMELKPKRRFKRPFGWKPFGQLRTVVRNTDLRRRRHA